MFCRRWSGLPPDPDFPSDLKALGYFINDGDEIRSIKDPKYYFKFFLSKNERWNDRQRFAFHRAVDALIATRLENEGMQRLLLPLGITDASQPHVPIYASVHLATATRVVVIVGQSVQALGVIAHRVVSGPGGITTGSMVSMVRALHAQRASAADDAGPPAVVLANAGQLWWWPEGGRGLCPLDKNAVPMRSAVHWGRFYDPQCNAVPGNATPYEHVRCVFEQVVARLAAPGSRIDVIGIGDGAEEVEAYLGGEGVWKVWSQRMSSLSLLGSYYSDAQVTCAGFRNFLRERARAWCAHESPLGTLISGPDGNANTYTFTRLGCPVFSSGESHLVEMLLVSARTAVLKWIQDVALAGEAYRNQEVVCTFSDLPEHTDKWGDDGNEANEGAEKKIGGADSDDEDKKEDGRINVRLRDMSLKD